MLPKWRNHQATEGCSPQAPVGILAWSHKIRCKPLVSPRLSVHFCPEVITLAAEGDVRIALTLHPAWVLQLLALGSATSTETGRVYGRGAGLPPLGLPCLGSCCPYVLQNTENSRHWSNMKSLRQNNK